VKYGVEWLPGTALLAAVVVLPLVPGFALIGVVVVALVAITALVALAGALLASPYLIVRTVRRRLAERRESTDGSARIVAGIAPTATAAHN
jgi:hypothetical protein